MLSSSIEEGILNRRMAKSKQFNSTRHSRYTTVPPKISIEIERGEINLLKVSIESTPAMFAFLEFGINYERTLIRLESQ